MFSKPSTKPKLNLEEEVIHHDQMPEENLVEDIETIVGPSVQVQGDFVSEGNIIVKGVVHGRVETSRQVSIEAGAKVAAEIKATDVRVAGEVQGNIKAQGLVQLEASARVLGDIECKYITVESGALFNGKISMPGLDQEPKPLLRASKASSKKNEREPEE